MQTAFRKEGVVVGLLLFLGCTGVLCHGLQNANESLNTVFNKSGESINSEQNVFVVGIRVLPSGRNDPPSSYSSESYSEPVYFGIE